MLIATNMSLILYDNVYTWFSRPYSNVKNLTRAKVTVIFVHVRFNAITFCVVVLQQSIVSKPNSLFDCCNKTKRSTLPLVARGQISNYPLCLCRYFLGWFALHYSSKFFVYTLKPGPASRLTYFEQFPRFELHACYTRSLHLRQFVRRHAYLPGAANSRFFRHDCGVKISCRPHVLQADLFLKIYSSHWLSQNFLGYNSIVVLPLPTKKVGEIGRIYTYTLLLLPEVM
jgi:hypothetical protein